MPQVTLYTRAGCCLCDQAKEVLAAARAQAAFDLEEVDIDRRPEYLPLYNDDVPVIAIDGQNVFAHGVDLHAFLKRLAEHA
ncbi:MAG TPA: glutaredoxin family protein [Bryobacteraceae bacterium]|nr:glutaredoxin family protein [Bryobacteraceae bacterium]